jgi:hypothetical protein
MDDCLICADALTCDMCEIGFVFNKDTNACEMDATCEAEFFSGITGCEPCIANCVVCGNAIFCS